MSMALWIRDHRRLDPKAGISKHLRTKRERDLERLHSLLVRYFRTLDGGYNDYFSFQVNCDMLVLNFLEEAVKNNKSYYSNLTLKDYLELYWYYHPPAQDSLKDITVFDKLRENLLKSIRPILDQFTSEDLIYGNY